MQITPSHKSFLLGLSISVLFVISFFAGAIADRIFVIKPLDFLARRGATALVRSLPAGGTGQTGSLVGTTGGSVADIAEVTSESVVTVSARTQERVLSPFSQGIFGFQFGQPSQGEVRNVQRDIGTGFVVEDGLVVTNRHVVSSPGAEYLVIDKNNQEHRVQNIYRDPVNDLAILQVESNTLPALSLGNSDQIRVGESVIAIGTALGEFRHTVTTGVVSGLGRGIEAIDGLGQAVETLEGVIQTDAAINPGNSGGPLINARGEVIGVNVAVTAGAQNIGFAIPINVVRASLDNFKQTGRFERAFFGVQYQLITERAALLNEVPQGAYVVEVVPGSSAAEAGLQPADIITSFDGQAIDQNTSLAQLINQKRIDDRVSVEFWRAGQTQRVEVELRGQE